MKTGATHIIGVDGGGSTCRVAIATAAGAQIGGAVGAAANPTTSMEQAIGCLLTVLEAARLDAGLTQAEMRQAATFMGLAGVINARLAAEVRAAMPFETLVVTEDRATQMEGALGGQDGYLVALGTGSFFGHQQGQARRYVGGWGLQLGDHASGAWMGRALLSRILEWRDGMHAASPLMEAVFGEFDTDPSRIALHAAQARPFDYGQWAPAVLEAARAGDAAGLAIVGAAAAHVEAVLSTLGFRTGDALCLTGGIGAQMAAFLDDRLTQNVIEPQGAALDGALRLAKRLAAGLDLDGAAAPQEGT